MTAPLVLGWLAADPLDPTACLAAVQRPDAGGQALFVGTVRDHDAGRPVASLTYLAHPTAQDQLRGLARQAAGREGVLAVAVAHRTGRLAVGDTAVVVAVSGAHRGPALATCQWLIDTIKTTVPIWKSQEFHDGEQQWVGAC